MTMFQSIASKFKTTCNHDILLEYLEIIYGFSIFMIPAVAILPV
jgi:hypothetical protein